MDTKNIFKEILSIILLVIGSLFILTGLINLFMGIIHKIGEITTNSIITAILFPIIGIFLILLGTYLYGWQRLKMVLGIIATVLGCILLIIGFSSPFEFFISGIIFLALGIFLIKKEK